MKRNDVYLRAAELVDKDYESASCLAIQLVIHRGKFGDEWHKLSTEYAALFGPHEKSGHSSWGHEWGENYKETKQCRVLALLFMHAIVNYKERK